MTSEERKKMFAICKVMVDEKDPTKFFYLVEEFYKLLDQKSDSDSTRELKHLSQPTETSGVHHPLAVQRSAHFWFPSPVNQDFS